MYICYVDESGDTSDLLTARAPNQPVLVVLGLIVPQPEIVHLTNGLLDIKSTFFPRRAAARFGRLDLIRDEIKGSELRKQVRSGSHRQRRQAIGILDKVVRLVQKVNARIVGRIWIKGVGSPVDDRSVYTFSVQAICNYTNAFCDESGFDGFIIADSRTAAQNRRVSHSVFTEKFRRRGDAHPRVLEMPTYGDSQNHAGLQIADLLAAGIVFPMASYTYCTGFVDNVHVHPDFRYIKDRFADPIRQLQFRFNELERWKGGLTVDDRLAQRHGGELFKI